MSYQTVDPIISTWAARHSFMVYKQYRDEEVRSISIISPAGKKYQIWIDPPEGETVNIHAWDYKKQRKNWNGTVEKLAENLEEAAQTVKAWMN